MKRSREAIIAQILGVCSKEASKTKIVYQANLNFRTVIPYINLLIEKGMIECRKSNRIIYKTTPKGTRLLKELKSIQNEFSENCDEPGVEVLS